jgi:predicted nucleic acid-binding protein
MYCLDSNIIIDILRGDEKVVKKVESFWNEEIFTTSINLCELYKGAYGHFNFEGKLKMIEEFLDNLNIISLDKESSREFALLWQKLKRRGKMINDFDVLIAAMVKSENLILVTRDKHFKNLGINVMII